MPQGLWPELLKLLPPAPGARWHEVFLVSKEAMSGWGTVASGGIRGENDIGIRQGGESGAGRYNSPRESSVRKIL